VQTAISTRGQGQGYIVWQSALVGLLLTLIAFGAGGGLNLEQMTTFETAGTIFCGLAAALAVATTIAKPMYGRWPVGLFFALSLLCGISIVWSVDPDASWRYTNRLFAYGAVFAAAALMARARPESWRAVLNGCVLASFSVCGYALLTKAFPTTVGAGYASARLQEPFGYWNATGVAAAMGVICCLWLGCRRDGHGLANALAFPSLGVCLVTLILTYSRGALVAAAIGVILWIVLVPLRTRAAIMLLSCGALAGLSVCWYFSKPALTADTVPLTERVGPGHGFGAVLWVMLLALTAIGAAANFFSARNPLRAHTRARLGFILLSIPAIGLLAVVGALFASHRGFVGTLSHGFNALTSTQAHLPSNDASRLTALSNERARYWREALDIFSAKPLTGSGADAYQVARLRYRTAPTAVGQAHGYIVQTLADLGLVGAVLTLALFLSWLGAAGRCTHPFNRRWSRWRWGKVQERYFPERIGMLTMLCVAVVFGAHSTIDWTWYTPGTACFALLCAGWLAGRGPLRADPDHASEPNHTRVPPRGTHPSEGATFASRRAVATLVILCASAIVAWSDWQPLRSVDAQERALALVTHAPVLARRLAEAATGYDPLSAEALSVLAVVQGDQGQERAARRTLAKMVRLQPSNPETWQKLGKRELEAGDPSAAVQDLSAAIFLNPQAGRPRTELSGSLLALQDAYISALRARSQQVEDAVRKHSAHDQGSSRR
jgi:hypothetical protein